MLSMSSCTAINENPPDTSSTVISPDMAETEIFVSPVYEALTEEEKLLYEQVKAAVIDFQEFVTFENPVPRDTVRKIYKLVYSQERKYFWLSNIFYAPEDEVTMLRLNYLYEREDAEHKRGELDFAASEIMGRIPEGASDFEKVVFFHDEIVRRCGFTTEKEHVNSAYGVLVTGYGQCEGYAAAMAMLCDKAGIPNYTVCGTNSEGSTHAWNKIRLDGDWYNADCTWDDPIIERNNPDFVRHDYLLVKDSEIEGKTHFTDELYKGHTNCEISKWNYFKGMGITFDAVSNGIDSIAEQVKTCGLAGTREVEIRFSSEDTYFAAMSRLFDSGEMKTIIEDINKKYGTQIRSAYKHNNDDLLIIHISLIYEGDEEN